MQAFLLALLALQMAEVPALTGRVVDLAGVLSPEERQQLEQRLEQEERQTSVQIVIATIPSLGGEPLEDFSMRLAEAWRIGQKGLDNGAIILVARDEHQIRIEVGYGLEAVIPDGLAGRIIGERITPHFRQGRFYEGLSGAVDGLLLAARREYPPQAQGLLTPVQVADKLPRVIGALFTVGFAWFVAFGILWDPANLRHWLTPAILTALALPAFVHMCGWLSAANFFLFAPLGFLLGAFLTRFGRLMDRATYGGSRTSWTVGSGGSRSSGSSSSSFGSSRSSPSSSVSGSTGFSGGGGRFGGGGASGRW